VRSFTLECATRELLDPNKSPENSLQMNPRVYKERMRYKNLFILLALFGCFGCLSQAFGEVITAGTIRIAAVPPSTLSLSGYDFSVTAGLLEDNWGPLNPSQPCAPGASLPVTMKQVGTDMFNGTAVFQSTQFPSIIWGSYENAKSSMFEITGPPIILDAGPGTYTSTFSFSGTFCGLLPPTGGAFGRPCDVDMPTVTGSGIVSVQVANYLEGPSLRVTEATYTFTDASAVPEPSTIALVGLVTGLLLVWRRRHPAMQHAVR
jgi:hypothetical protein